MHIAEALGYEFRLLKEVQQINTSQIERFLKKIHETLWIVKDKTVGVLGLAFKAEHGRHAPGCAIIGSYPSAAERRRENSRL